MLYFASIQDCLNGIYVKEYDCIDSIQALFVSLETEKGKSSFLMDSSVKEKIVQAAAEQFYKYGYSSITMDIIADSLGMSKKTLYTVFTGKYDLLVHVVEYFKKDLSNSVNAILESKDLVYREKFKAFLITIGNKLSAVSHEFIDDLQDNLPEVWESLKHYKMESAYLRFIKLVKEGIKEGYISKQVNINVVVAMYASSIQSLMDDRFMVQLPDTIRKGLPNHPAQTFDAIVQILFNGIEDKQKVSSLDSINSEEKVLLNQDNLS
ncbi:TetR/AcrR family transcriptional regulator [bacterium]|nr:MAG: TetR/AcrR family transcriptional regulator [bacterium]